MASREFELGGGVKIGFSPLLVCMMLGTVFCNFSEYSVDIMDRSSKWTAPLYALFFVLSGAELDLGVFRYPAIILIGVVYILTRCIMFIRDGVVFHQIYKGEATDQQMYQKISDTLTLLAQGGERR